MKGHYTGADLSKSIDIVQVGGMIAGSKFQGVDVSDHHEAMKKSRHDFDDMQANCNTCANLRRIQAPKDKHGFLYGELGAECRPVTALDGKTIPAVNGAVIMFHPHDCYGMTCYKPRNPTNGKDKHENRS